MEFIKEIHTSQIRELLNQQQIKLWLSPYYNNDTGPSNKDLEDLSSKLSKELHIESKICYDVITELQLNALNRLKENKQFNETGIATFKIRFVNSDKKTTIFSLSIKLSSNINDLLKQVSQHLDIDHEKIKLIANGKVLNELKDSELNEIGLKNGKVIMALLINDISKENESYLKHKMLEDTKADAAFLAGKSGPDYENYIQIADQNGKPLNLPQNEQKALIVAMALHEKGRAALKKNDYSLALIFFLEADKEFSLCQAKILEMVDNFALLNLDIAWTYLCLRSISHLNEVEKRLKFCEQCFKKSYGENLERLIVLKGTIGKETALFMRLHLLQAIINFHLARFEKSKELLLLAEKELSCLQVDESKVLLLAELGYTMAESRLALRVSHGEIIPAESYLSKKKQEKLAETKKEEEQKKKLLGMGFNMKRVNSALAKFNGDFEEALLYLVENSKSLVNNSNDIGLNLPSTSQDAKNNAKVVVKKKKEQMKQESEAYDRLSEGISTYEEDHLNLTLESEETFLIEYKSLLENHFSLKN